MVSYVDVLKGDVEVGARVAIVGAGGIGFDVADFLTEDADAKGFLASWGWMWRQKPGEVLCLHNVPPAAAM